MVLNWISNLLEYLPFSRIIPGFYWNNKMAYASYFETKVTELRFRCLQWTIYLPNLNNEVDFQIYEDENNSIQLILK